MVVEYYNYDRIEFSTDLSWTTNDAYTYPSLLKPFDPTKAPVVAATPDFASDIETPEFSEWNITVPYGSLDKVQNTVLKLIKT